MIVDYDDLREFIKFCKLVTGRSRYILYFVKDEYAVARPYVTSRLDTAVYPLQKETDKKEISDCWKDYTFNVKSVNFSDERKTLGEVE